MFAHFRLENAAAKIESLKGNKTAIKIYSPAKYPITNPPKFVATFSEGFKTSEIDFNYNIQNIPAENLEQKKYSDKLQFFHLKRKAQQKETKPSLVFTTKSVNSLITFVNNENIVLNEQGPRLRSNNQIVIKETEDNDSTDFSRFSTLIKNKHDNDSFHYFPNMNQAPEIELPMDLPDLPGIVLDVSFNASDQDLIVPSLAKMNIINELPNVSDLIQAESSKKIQENKDQVPSEIQSEEQKIPAPPPVPVNIPPPPPIPSSFIPPPPPAPSAVGRKPESQEKPFALPANDGRSSLMEAIRNAAGKSVLRSIPAAEEQSPMEEKKKPKAAPAGDLMSDLHAKLALRRRGIAGSKEAKKEKKVSLMDKVSSLIPPPPKRSDSDDESSNSNSDWE